MSGKFWSVLAGLAGVTSFFQITTRSDAQNLSTLGQYSGGKAWDKLKALGICFVERLTNGAIKNQNANLSTGTIGGLSSKPTWNIMNTFNWATGVGIFAEIYKRIPGLPQRSKVGKFGIPMIVAGVAGGLLDDASGQAVSRSSNYVRNSPQLQLRGATTTGVNAH